MKIMVNSKLKGYTTVTHAKLVSAHRVACQGERERASYGEIQFHRSIIIIVIIIISSHKEIMTKLAHQEIMSKLAS